MDIFKIISVAIIICITILVVKNTRPEIALVITVAGSVLLMGMALSMFSSVFSSIQMIIEKTGIDGELFAIVLKIVGIGYLTEFAANICTDSGNSSIADKVLLCGKIFIMITSLPIIVNLLEIIIGMLP